MPDGKRWMTENLNIETDDSWCYNNSADSCNKYGRLYDWETANTVCPNGWKLPDTADWNRLVTTAGGKDIAGKKLKSKSGWNDFNGKSGNGTDDYGFSALPGGWRYSDGRFDAGGEDGCWWTATEYVDNRAYLLGMELHRDAVGDGWNEKSSGRSVRCVKDE